MPVIGGLPVRLNELDGLQGHTAELREHSPALQRIEIGGSLQGFQFRHDHVEHLRRILDVLHGLGALDAAECAYAMETVEYGTEVFNMSMDELNELKTAT